MKFAVVSLKNTQRIVEVIQMFGHDIDNNKPDFVITYGGDGTVLYGERKYPGIPKITIKAGSIGFKCMYSEHDLEDVIIKIDNGKYKLKEETKLETTFKERKYLSLNEVHIHNSTPIKVVRFSVYVNDKILFENTIGDGVVIATPFGSTGYYSSIGGEKFNKGIGIALNNPYNTKRDSIIIDDGFDPEICIIILQKETRGGSEEGLLLFDNDDNIIKIKGGDEIKIKKAKNTAKFVTI